MVAPAVEGIDLFKSKLEREQKYQARRRNDASQRRSAFSELRA